MSLGYSTVKIVNLAQLALQTVQNAKRACGEHDELTREVTSLHAVLSRLQKTAQQPDSLLNKSDEATKTEIESTVEDCGKVLEVLAKILDKYNSLSEETKAVRKLWTRVRFGNGEMMDLGDLRSKVGTYTSLITLQVNLIALGSQGRVEDHLSRHGSRLKAMQQSINFITASLSTGREASILTIYSGDDKLVWRELRRELVAEGFSSNVISKHKTAIVAYVKDLGDRGIFDELTESETSTPQVITVPAVSRVSRSSLKDVAGKTLRTSLESTNSPPREHWYRRIFRRPNTPDYGLAYRGKFTCLHCRKTRELQSLVLRCGHTWCLRCYMDYGLICVFATNKLEPHGCCEAVISEASVKYRRELDSQISERFNSVLNREEIEELEGRPDHEDLIYRLCPQPRCAKLIQSSTSSTPYTRSSPKILRCTHCRKDMCLICNDIIHTPTPYCNMLTLMGNLFRIGMLKSILLVLHGTDYGDIISSLNEDDDGEFWARCKVCFDEILRDVCSEPEFKKQD